MKLICLKNNRVKIYKIISMTLLIAWMIIVFILSNETSDSSTKRSNSFISNILKVLNKDINEQELDIIIENITPIIRKTAHFIIYTLGGIIIYNLYSIYNTSINRVQIISILYGILYSVMDELHQLIVPGRSGELRDVIIDSVGIILGVFICSFLFKIFRRFKWKKI